MISHHRFFDSEVSLTQFPSSGVHGLTLWDSGLVLAKTIETLYEKKQLCFGSRVIELAAGLALPSLSLLTMDSLKKESSNLSVFITDSDPEVLRVTKETIVERNTFIRKPVEELTSTIQEAPCTDNNSSSSSSSSISLFSKTTSSEGRIYLGRLDLLEPPPILPPASKFDLILFSDLLYDPSLYEPLVNTLDALSGENTMLLFANEKRDFGSEMEFYRMLGKKFSFKPVKDLHPEFQSEDIYVFEARRKNVLSAKEE